MKGRYDEGPAPKPSRILIVDDDPAILKLLELYLTAEGLRVACAGSGQEALDIIALGDVALALLDIRMPQMDGIELCRRIRANPANARLPIVFLTAEFKDVATEIDGLEAGATDYLHKPVPRRALVARVRNLLRLTDAERDQRVVAQVAQTEKFAAIGQIAAGVAHEINNPLGFILSNISSLKGYLADLESVVDAYRRDPEAGHERENEVSFAETLRDIESLIRETEQGGQRVRHIVQGLKTFSRASDAALEPVDLANIAGETAVLTEREIARRARFTKELAPAPLSRAPRGELHQVVLNLLVNALQALDERGPEANRISMATGTDGSRAFLSVADSGCGIPPEQLNRIFDPFFTTKPVGIGTGMGLSVCATTVRRLGGEIDVRSALGKGSTFTVLLPRGAVESN